MKFKSILLMSVIYCMISSGAWGLSSEKSGQIYYPKDGASLVAIHNTVVASGDPAHYKLSYSGSGVSTPYYITSGVTFEDYETFEVEPYAYLVAASGVTVRYGRAPIASMQCFDGPGVILPIEDSNVIDQINAVWYGQTAVGIQLADDAASITNSSSLYIPGGFYSSVSSVTFRCEKIECGGKVRIIKALSDEPVVIFDDNLKFMSGYMYARQGGRPSVAQTNASGFRFRNIIHAEMPVILQADQCYNSFENADETPGTGVELSWGNNFGKWLIRDFVNSAISWDYPGAGNHTGNNWDIIYINGSQFDASVRLEVENPIYFNNADSQNISVLNLEWCRLTSTGDAFIKLSNHTSLNIGVFHFEGNESIYAGIDNIFLVSTGASDRSDISVGSMQIGTLTQHTGTRLNLLKTGTSATNGSLTVGSFRGDPSHNSVVNFSIATLGADSPYRINLLNPENWTDYFTSVYAGTSVSSEPNPVFMFGNQVLCPQQFISNTSGVTEFHMGGADSLRVYGSPSTVDIVTIDATPRYAQGGNPDEVENIRMMVLDNASTGNMIVSNAGNIDLTQVSSGTTILWTEDMLGNYVFNTDTFYVTTYN